MPDTESFSEGVDVVLHMIRPYGRIRSSFPADLGPGRLRQERDENLHGWFMRIVDVFCGGDPRRCAIEDNIALFMSLFWEDRKTIAGAHICTLIATCDLEEYYTEQPTHCDVVCLRLDLDYGSLGEPFSHSLPHIHVQGSFSPRFSLDGGDSGNIVMDYLEFIYRQFVPTKWKAWMEREWNKDFRQTRRAEEHNVFPRIMGAFAESQIAVLRQHAVQVTRLKQLLRKRKDELFGFHMNSLDRKLVEYPEAR